MESGPDEGSGTYVYGIATGEVPSGLGASAAVGDRRRPIRHLESDGLWAIVSDAPQGLVEASRENLRAHNDAIQQVLESASALLPLRFGTVFPGDDAIRHELLEGRRGELEPMLARVEGRAEVRVKAFYDEEAVLREVVAEDRRVVELRQRARALPEDASYYLRIELGELVGSALAAKRDRDASFVLARLAPLAVEYMVDDDAHEWGVLAASFLVERPRLSEFESAVETLAHGADGRMAFTCVGPLAAYSFVHLALEPAGVS